MNNATVHEAEAYGPHLTYRQAGDYLGGVSRQAIWRLLKAGEIRGATIGAKVVIFRDSLDEYLAEHPYSTNHEEDNY